MLLGGVMGGLTGFRCFGARWAEHSLILSFMSFWGLGTLRCFGGLGAYCR